MRAREIASTTPNLPSNFVERLFLRSPGHKARTIAQVERVIAKLTDKLTKQQTILAELKKKEENARRAQHEAKLSAKQKQLTEAQRKAAEAAADLAAIQAEIDEGDGGDTSGGEK